MKKKLFTIAIIVALLLVGFGITPVSSIKTAYNKTINDEKPLVIVTSGLSVDLKVRKSGGSSWSDSISNVKVNDKLEFKIIISSTENTIVAVQFPYIDNDIMLSYVVGSASEIPVIGPPLTYEALAWGFTPPIPSEITFEVNIKKAGTASVYLVGDLTEYDDVSDEDYAEITASGKSRALPTLPFRFNLLVNLLRFFKIFDSFLPYLLLVHTGR